MVKCGIKPLTAIILMLVLIINLIQLPNHASASSGVDEYDMLRSKIYDVLTGGDNFDPTDPDISPRISGIEANGQKYWSTINNEQNRTYLWSDLSDPLGPNMDSTHLSGSYSRLAQMAIAYSTRGTSLYSNPNLLADIISGMDWMYANRYTLSVPVRGYGNWYDWQISSPNSINTVSILLYSHLTTQQLSDWHAALDRQTLPLNASNAGANRVWTCNIMITSGIIMKNSAKITTGVGGLSLVLDYVKSGEGFYRDGSFLQHTALIPYNGGYGLSLVDSLTQVMYNVAGSSWDITDPNLSNVYQFIYDAYEPLFYNNNMMAIVIGRNNARRTSDDKGFTSIGMLGSTLVRLAYSASNPADASRYKSMIKQWMNEATSQSPYASLGSIQLVLLTKAIMNDSVVTSRGELVLNKQYPNMARTVHRRPGFAFGISMSSNKVGNYELVNNENLKGWHTGEGMAYLYNSDLSQYMDSFWPTIDSHRMPGTTVIQNSETPGQLKNGSNWVGGTDASGLYGVTGMQVQPPGSSLSANKSWFMFDDEIVNLGAGIQSMDSNNPVETIVENRKLNGNGDNQFTVNGVEKMSDLGWSEKMSSIDWAHLAGNTSGSDIGYYFPQKSDIKGLRESRTANWNSINNYFNDSSRYPEYFEDITRNYLTLWFDHGAAPTDGTYSYVLLPNKSASEVASYASNPDITVLENSREAQAVKENKLGITGINFWQDTVKTVAGVTSNKKASVMIRTGENGTEVSLSDPTMENTGTIEISLATNVGTLAYVDPGVTVSTNGSTTKLVVNVNGALGKSLKVRFNNPGTPSAGPNVPTGLTASENTNNSIKLSWNVVEGATDYRLYRSDALNGQYASILNLQPGETTFTDTNLEGATNYYYKVVALNASGVSAYSESVSTWTVPVSPTGLNVVDKSDTGISLSWQAVQGATGYLLYRSDFKDGPFQVMNSVPVTGVTYIDSDILSGTNYFYKVAAVNTGGASQPSTAIPSLFGLSVLLINEDFNSMTTGNLNGQNLWVGDNGGITVNDITVLPKVVSGTDKSVKLSTKATGGKSEAYKLFNAPQGSLLTVEDTVVADDINYKNALLVVDSSKASSNSATHIVMQNGKIWGYNGGTQTDILTSIAIGVPYRLKVVINTSTKKFDVYVNDQLRASQWNYRYSAVSNLDKFFVGNSGSVNSSMSFDDVKVSYMPLAPGNLQASALSSSSINLTWSASPGAVEYRLYRSASPDSGFKLISVAGFVGLSYTDENLSANKTYSYKVVAVIQQAVSPESATVSATTSTAPPPAIFGIPAYLINENFNGLNIGNLNGQNGWVGDNGGVTANTIAVQLKTGSTTDKSVKLTTKATGGSVDAYKLFNAPQGSIVNTEVTATADDIYWKNALLVADSSLTTGNLGVQVVMQNGKMFGYNGGSRADILPTMSTGVPYRLKAVINTSTKKFDLYVNDELKASQWSYRYAGISKLDKVWISEDQTLNRSMSFDDVKVSYMPLAPGNVQASPLSDTSIGLTWSAAPGAAEYRVFRSVSPDTGFELISEAGITGLSYIDKNLSANTSYYYKVAAKNQQSVSLGSTAVFARTLAPVDQTAPITTSAISGTIGSGGWYPQDVTVTLSTYDAGSGVASTLYKLNDGAWTVYNAMPITISGEGTNTLQIYSTDKVGNVEAVQTVRVMIDKAAPALSLTQSGQLVHDVLLFDMLQFTLTAIDSLSGVVSQSLILDGKKIVSGSLIPASELGLGTHTISVAVVDSAGNTAEQSWVFRINIDFVTFHAWLIKLRQDGQIKNDGIQRSVEAKLSQAESQQLKGHLDQAIKHLNDLAKTLDTFTNNGNVTVQTVSDLKQAIQYFIDTELK